MKLARGDLVAILLLVLSPFLIYAPSFLNDYAITDSWAAMTIAKRWGLQPFSPFHTEQGRPLLNLFFWLFLRGDFASMGGLRLLRLLGVAGTAFFGLCAYWGLAREPVSRMERFSLAMLFCTTPSFAVYSTWAMAGPYSLLAGLAFLSGVFARVRF